MPSLRRTPTSFPYTLWGCVVALILSVVLGVTPVSAHSELESISPATITLTFNEEVSSPRIVVRGSDKAMVAGTTRGNSEKVIFTTTRALRNGAFTVNWRVRSADGHFISGTSRFAVKQVP
ncbi:MAG: copper resistance protein CopC [Actinobacteria bacterium]|nr:copper resistance protein CopC [Actinomycetota bacterium]